jgi:hypothetical protein
MCSKCLFRKGVSPCANMRAKLVAARARRISDSDPEIEEFLVKVRGLLAETYARVDGQKSGRNGGGVHK